MKRFNDDFSVGDLMKDFLQKNKLENGLDAVNVKQYWLEILGTPIMNYTTQLDLYKNVLYVSLSSSIVKSELLMGKEKIRTMLNESFGKEVVKDIVFR
jgi:Dna[CI] antecedent, DciA